MRLLLSEAIPDGDRKKIEEAIREPYDLPLRLFSQATVDFPLASEWPYALEYDLTIAAPKWSDGTSWNTLAASSGANSWTGIQTFLSNPVLAGGGIQFPATQVPSADPNCLDDYEEGTWTPGMAFGGGATGITYTTRTGTYTKIGRQVTVHFQVLLSAKGSSTGEPSITGLPFAAASGLSTNILSCRDLAAGPNVLQVRTLGTTVLGIYDTVAGIRTPSSQAHFTNISDLIGSITYTV